MRAFVDDATANLRRLRRAELVVPDVQPTWRSRWQRLLFGFTLPFVIGNACLSDPALGRRARRVLGLQAVVAALLGCLWFWLIDVDDFVQEKDGFRLSLSNGSTGIIAFLTALSLTEWLVIALSREFHDEIGAGAARLLAVPPDEEVTAPRVRLNLGWVWLKLRRRIQGVVVMIISIAPALFLALGLLLVLLPFFGSAINVGINLLSAMILFYWVAVVALGKTSWAWRTPPDRDPLPLLVLSSLSARSPLFAPLRVWELLLRKAMALIVRPARLLELCAWEGAGLAGARLLMTIPVAYVVARPFFPVASTILLHARAPGVFVPAGEAQLPTASIEPVPTAATPTPTPTPMTTE